MNKATDRISLKEASQLLGMNPQSVREHMKHKLLPIGYVFSPQQTGKSQWQYVIYRNLVEKYIRGE